MNAGSPLVNEGSAHGRFQPFHKDHLEYVLAAKERCEFLWIGITKYDIAPDQLNPLGRVRERPESNPLTFYERQRMIRRSLVAKGVAESDFGFVPFPIETPTHLPLFHPTHIRCFTTIREEWNREKIGVLRAAGYEVEVLWERGEKAIQGTIIRASLIAGDTLWPEMVPPEVAESIREIDLASRLRRLAGSSGQSG